MSRYDFKKLFLIISKAIAERGPIGARMRSVIDECAAQRPHEDWERFRGINYDADILKAGQWIAGAVDHDNPAQSRRGLWFGIFTTMNDGIESVETYAAVVPHFNSGEDNWTGYVRQGRKSYLDSRVGKDIHALAYSSDNALRNDADYPISMAYGGMIACYALMNTHLPPELDQLESVMWGFDDGDILFLGSFKNGEFVPIIKN